jgi:biotin synthase
MADTMAKAAAIVNMKDTAPRHNWTRAEVRALFALPFPELIFKALGVHREHHKPDEIQLSTLLSIKTGGCAEDCAYCPQSAKYDTGLKASKLMDKDTILTAARAAKEAGAGRFCMGAAWREPKERDMPALCDIVNEVKSLGLETCMTLGMLTPKQASDLKQAGLDYYNHNIDTSPEYYDKIITTRTFDERLDTLQHVRDSGMKVCCGGIVGMGESLEDRASFLESLANLPQQPESVPINLLIKIPGTPLEHAKGVDIFDFIRTIAVARIMMPASYVRLSAGREAMSEETQALCFIAGANSMFYGDKLLTAGNPEANNDMALLAKLGMKPEVANVQPASASPFSMSPDEEEIDEHEHSGTCCAAHAPR